MKQFNNSAIQPFNHKTINIFQKVTVLVILFFIFYFLFFISKLWYADIIFTRGYHANRNGEYLTAFENLQQAITLNEKEPLYYDEFAYPAAEVAVALFYDKKATLSSQIKDQAVAASNMAILTSPNNINFWKTRTRVFYSLYKIDPEFLKEALFALEKAKELSPTDPKVTYNLGVIYDKIGEKKKAFEFLDETTRLKPDYRDAYFAKALFYERDKEKEKAKEMLEFILNRIATDDAEAKKKLEELK